MPTVKIAPFCGLLLLVSACGSPVTAGLPRGGAGGSGGSAGGHMSGGSGGGGGTGAASPELSCTDGKDDDGDGAVDCADVDCTPETVLANDVAEPFAEFAQGTGGRGLIVYSATGMVGANRRIRALPVDGVTAAGPSQVIYEGPSVWVEPMPRGDGGFAVALASKDTSRIELALLDADGKVVERHVLIEGDLQRPLISAALDPTSGHVVVLRVVDLDNMEFAWFQTDGMQLTAWRDMDVLQFHSARLIVTGGRVWLLHMPNYDDDALGGRMIRILPNGGYDASPTTVPLRAHCQALVPRDGEIVFHGQGAHVVGQGLNDGPEFVRVDLKGKALSRFEVAQPDGELRLATFVGAWDGGVGAVYPGTANGKEVLVVVRASADLAHVDPAIPLLPGLPTVVRLESNADEDRVFYVAEKGRELRVRVVPAHCRP